MPPLAAIRNGQRWLRHCLTLLHSRRDSTACILQQPRASSLYPLRCTASCRISCRCTCELPALAFSLFARPLQQMLNAGCSQCFGGGLAAHRVLLSGADGQQSGQTSSKTVKGWPHLPGVAAQQHAVGRPVQLVAELLEGQPPLRAAPRSRPPARNLTQPQML